MPKKTLQKTFETLLDQLHPNKLIEQSVSLYGNSLTINDTTYELPEKITLLGSGKAVLPMAEATLTLLDAHIEQCCLVGPYTNYLKNKNINYIKSTHPIPSTNSIIAGKTLIEVLSNLNEDDFFIYLLSGGNSALVELPASGISLDDFQKTTNIMIQGAMPIEAINCVRKHISLVKGGRLGQFTKAKGIVLVLSDVLENDLGAIGSGPLYCDNTTYQNAIDYLNEFQLFDKIPKAVQKFLIEQPLSETPKEPNPNIVHHVLGSNSIVLEKTKSLLEHKGIQATIMEQPIEGDVNIVASNITDFINNYQGNKHCFLFGGEATVKVTGDGHGGRNQHLALLILDKLDGTKDVAVLCGATDGIDGNTQAAGALIDMHSIVNTKARHLNWKHYIDNFDSNGFFKKTDELLITGPTHNNMLDIVMVYFDSTLKQGNING